MKHVKEPQGFRRDLSFLYLRLVRHPSLNNLAMSCGLHPPVPCNVLQGLKSSQGGFVLDIAHRRHCCADYAFERPAPLLMQRMAAIWAVLRNFVTLSSDRFGPGRSVYRLIVDSVCHSVRQMSEFLHLVVLERNCAHRRKRFAG